MSTAIQWTDETWNPVTGCTKVSPGCKNCYAETIAERFWGTRKFTDVRCHEDRLDMPTKWKKPRMIFVNSMSDLFHEDVPLEFIMRVFLTMAVCGDHIYQVLTKREKRMADVMNSAQMAELEDGYDLGNIWLGVSVESRKQLERIDRLREIRAKVRWVSLEPLLENIGELNLEGIHWVVIGGESGLLKDVRRFNIDWARDIIRQCKAANVPVFMKQIGSHAVKTDINQRIHTDHKKGGRMDEWPEDLRIREYPPTQTELL